MLIDTAILHEAYHGASYADTVAMANLGAICWLATKTDMFAHWQTAMTAEESDKEAALREEGRRDGAASMLESVKARLGLVETLAIRLATAEATISQIQSGTDAEVAKRAEALVTAARKDFELERVTETSTLKALVAAAEAKEEMFSILKANQKSLRAHTESLESELAKIKATKSSHALGKIGEAEVFDMLNSYVLPRFPYAELRDMTAVKHVADFHLWVFGPNGNRIKIMIDSKKYTSPVQTGEVEKLYSDVDADEEAHAGLMVSIDSAVYTKAQFHISKTKIGKPCLFVSFEMLDDGIRQEVLCWAIRALVSVVSVHDNVKQDNILEDVQLFLTELYSSVSDMDSCLKTCRTLCDSLRDAKDRLVGRMTTFRIRSGLVSAEDMITHATDAYPRCVGVASSGERCKGRLGAKGDMCSRHTAMEASGKTVARAKL
jgi:hypothetical protein